MSSARRLRVTLVASLFGSAVLVTGAMFIAIIARWITAPRSRRQAPAKAPRTAGQFGAGAQRASSGVGQLMHRRYSVDIPRSPANRRLSSVALMGAIKSHIARLSPAALAEFHQTHGEPGAMRVGDEYDITMLGPWNGRVRVVAVARESFTLMTLTGHPEAGHISFRVQRLRSPGRPFRVSIESWARSRNATVDLMYSKLGVGKHMQARVWVTFLQRACALAGLKVPPRVRVTSEEVHA